MEAEEFKEIGHSGGKVTFTISTTKEGKRRFRVGYSHSRPGPMTLVGVQALPQGIPVAPMTLGGLGDPLDLGPGLFPVLIASDSHDQFGHECPSCQGYWRSGPEVQFCPYCRHQGARHVFLTKAQREYVGGYCDLLNSALGKPDGDHVIDLDAVADAVCREGTKPAFYYSEESQQNKFTCSACKEFNDILGAYAYCSGCGTRNDLDELRNRAVKEIRARINAGGPYEACVKDAVAAFDSFIGKYVAQLLGLVKMTSRRRRLFEGKLFHNLRWVADTLQDVFDINILRNIAEDDVRFAVLLFHRRHIYEHKGGEVDQKYLDDSGDTSVRLGQAIHETQESAHRIVGVILRMAANLASGFHELCPPDATRIQGGATRPGLRGS